MAPDPGPHDLDSCGLVLTPDGGAVAKPFGPAFYEELDSEFSGFAGHYLMARHAFTENWPTWEMHPAGDEIVYLLSGDIDFVLWENGAETVVRVDRPGSAVLVPRGVWHTARPRTPTAMLFVTPGEGTQNADAPPSPPADPAA